MSSKKKKQKQPRRKESKKEKEVIENQPVAATEKDTDLEAPQAPTRPEEAETEAEEKTESIEEETAEPEKVEAPAKADEEEETEEEKDEGLEIVEEKFYDLNLRKIWLTPRQKRTPRAMRYVREYIARRMKSDQVSISEETNHLLWARGISKPPRRLRLRAVKDKEGKVIVFPGEGR